MDIATELIDVTVKSKTGGRRLSDAFEVDAKIKADTPEVAKTLKTTADATTTLNSMKNELQARGVVVSTPVVAEAPKNTVSVETEVTAVADVAVAAPTAEELDQIGTAAGGTAAAAENVVEGAIRYVYVYVEANECFCNSGVAASGSLCPATGSHFCVSCHPGYVRSESTGQCNPPATDPIVQSPSAGQGDTAPPEENKQCICSFGQAASGSLCPATGSHFCVSCHEGYARSDTGQCNLPASAPTPTPGAPTSPEMPASGSRPQASQASANVWLSVLASILLAAALGC
jgi:hypothetical protein